MKRNVYLFAGIASLAVLSTSAFASKARMEALGQGDASYYLMDSRTVFVNPAALNDMKNYVVTEWGTSTYLNTSATRTRNDAATTPRAEGGFFREMGAFSYGLYLGNNGATRANTAPANTASTDGKEFIDHQNGLDLMFAGDMGLKWGARLHYANTKDETQLGTGTTAFTKKNSALGIAVGVEQGDMSVYLNTDLSDTSDGATVEGDQWKRKPGYDLGASYKWAGMTFFADYAATNEDVTAATGSGLTSVFNSSTTIAAGSTVNHKTSALTVGAARVYEVNPTARVVADARFSLATNEVGGSSNATGVNGKSTTTALPLTFAIESDATSWLTLRGSVSQNVIIGNTNSVAGKTTTTANSTTVNGGATLNFGKLKVDGVIGTTDASRSGTINSKSTGTLATDNLMTRVGVLYNF